MRDLKDLDAAWRALERRADAYPLPEFAADEAASRARSARRRWLAVAGASAAVAAAVAVPLALSRGGGGTQPQQHSAAHVKPARPTHHAAAVDWSTLDKNHYLFVFDKMPGTKITSIIGVPETGWLPKDDTYQEVQTDGPYGRLVFKVNAPGAWAPPTDAATTTVNGATAYYGLMLRHPEIPNHPVPPRWSLAWQYAPGAWVTVGDMSGGPMPLDTARTVAGLVQIGDGGPIPHPLPQDR
jgi:hypothetical protein